MSVLETSEVVSLSSASSLAKLRGPGEEERKKRKESRVGDRFVFSLYVRKEGDEKVYSHVLLVQERSSREDVKGVVLVGVVVEASERLPLGSGRSRARGSRSGGSGRGDGSRGGDGRRSGSGGGD